MSTSLIHNIASEGELVQALEKGLNLIFQTENVESVRKFRDLKSVDQPNNSAAIHLLLEREFRYNGKRFRQSTCSSGLGIDTLLRSVSPLQSKCYTR